MNIHNSSPTSKSSSIVAHLVVVGFHAQLGNRIEFAYPRLRGDPVLRSPKIWDTADISADIVSPLITRRPSTSSDFPTPTSIDTIPITSLTSTPSHLPTTPISTHPSSDSSLQTPQSISQQSPHTPSTTPFRPFATTETPPSPQNSRSQEWGQLPDEWSFLPFMALPDGVHDRHQDVVFFTLPPDVHCVACFRQAGASTAKTHSASAGRSYERHVAARGSVQKSVVLLCRRPFFGALADRLVPAVRAYFEQADFAQTHVLSSLFHSLNVSLSRPSLAVPDTLFHGLDLRNIIRQLGIQTLAVLKLIMLEKRIIVYSQPVQHACNTVVALASIFPGALDTTAPSLPPLDVPPKGATVGHPLSLFGPDDRIILQPYAPLPLLSEIIPNHISNACLIGTSHNVGLLLSSSAAAAAAVARKTSLSSNSSSTKIGQPNHNVTPSRPPTFVQTPTPSPARPSQQAANTPVKQSTPNATPSTTTTPDRPPLHTPVLQSRNQGASSEKTPLPPSSSTDVTPIRRRSTTPAKPQRQSGGGGVPIVDALISLSNGKVSVSAALEPLCRVTRQERAFMRDLMRSSVTSSASVSSSGATGSFVGSDDYIRSRLREYLNGFLRSVASVNGVVGGPAAGETWSKEMVEQFDFSGFTDYNESFVKAWMTTRNAAQWARKCSTKSAIYRPPPKAEFEEPVESLIPNFAAGFSSLRQNLFDFGKFSKTVSTGAAEGITTLLKRVDQEVGRMDTAVRNAATNMQRTEQQSTNTTSSTLVGTNEKSNEEKDDVNHREAK